MIKVKHNYISNTAAQIKSNNIARDGLISLAKLLAKCMGEAKCWQNRYSLLRIAQPQVK